MEAPELDILIDELETRVERLRSLYEQYFLGIEKIPPQVAQKEVDRRLYALRREQIRNTARRFKLQTIIQRYNTFQQYWMRIMRDIENGTYRRHVLRAERTVGVTDLLTAAERKRAALPERELLSTNTPTVDATQGATPEEAPSPAASPVPATPPVAAAPSTETRLATPIQSARAVRAQIERDLGLLLDDDLEGLDTKGLAELGTELDDPLLSSMPPPLRRKPSAKPVARRSTRPNSERQRENTSAPPQTRPTPSSPKSTAKPTSQQRVGPLPTSTTQSAIAQVSRRSLHPNRGLTSSGRPATPGGLRLPASSAVAGRGLPPLSRTGTPRGAPARIPSSPIIAIEGKPPPSTVTATERGRQPTRSIADQLKVSPQPPARSEAIPVVTAQPSPRPKSVQPASNQAHASGAKGPDGVDRVQVERIAEKLRDARKVTNEAAPVSFDALAKKLQATTDLLRQKHQGRQVDFDVVIKDGKAIVKPIIR